MIAAGIFLASFLLYLRTICPTIALGDSAELVLMGANLDVAHAPGYPPFALLLRLAMGLPVGGIAFRAGLVAAAAGAGAVACVYSTARVLGTSRFAAVLGAAILAIGPWVWLQSASLEKYGLVMLLCGLTLRVLLDPRRRPLLSVALFGLALAHHPIAMFLVPAVAFVVWRSRPRVGVPRFRAILTVFVLLPLSLRALYPAIRAEELRSAQQRGQAVINFGEPRRLASWWKYLRLGYYGDRFTGRMGALARPTLRQHLAVYRDQFGWIGLLLAAAGLAHLWMTRRNDALALASVWLLSLPFNLAFITAPPVVADYHVVELLTLAILAAVGIGELVRRLESVRPVQAAVTFLLATGLLLEGRARWPQADLSRLFLMHDYGTAQLAVCPRGALLVSTYDQELCIARYLKELLGRREDLVLGQVPFLTSPGMTVGRLLRQPWLPPAPAAGRSERETAAFDRALLVAGARTRCEIVGGASAPLLPAELFRPFGGGFVSRLSPCAGSITPARAVAVLRGASSRSWYLPSARLPANWIRVGHWAAALERLADGGDQSPAVREALLRRAARLAPEEPGTWMALAAVERSHGQADAAETDLERALALAPSSPPARWALLEALVADGRQDRATVLLREILSGPAGARARAALDRGDMAGAVGAARRMLAEDAVDQALAAPYGSAWEDRQLPLLLFAARVAPEWDRAQRECGRLLQARARWDQAMEYVNRLRTLSPEDVSLLVAQGAGLLEEGRAAQAAELLREAVGRAPRDSAGWFYLGQAALVLGRTVEVNRAFTAYLALGPDPVEARKARAVLARLQQRGGRAAIVQ